MLLKVQSLSLAHPQCLFSSSLVMKGLPNSSKIVAKPIFIHTHFTETFTFFTENKLDSNPTIVLVNRFGYIVIV